MGFPEGIIKTDFSGFLNSFNNQERISHQSLLSGYDSEQEGSEKNLETSFIQASINNSIRDHYYLCFLFYALDNIEVPTRMQRYRRKYGRETDQTMTVY